MLQALMSHCAWAFIGGCICIGICIIGMQPAGPPAKCAAGADIQA